MSCPRYHDHLELALHLSNHQLFVEPICPGEDQKSCSASGEERRGQAEEPACNGERFISRCQHQSECLLCQYGAVERRGVRQIYEFGFADGFGEGSNIAGIDILADVGFLIVFVVTL